MTKKPPKKSGNSPREMLYRMGVLLGGVLALVGLLLAMSGFFLYGYVLIGLSIPLAGVRRVAQWVDI